MCASNNEWICRINFEVRHRSCDIPKPQQSHRIRMSTDVEMSSKGSTVVIELLYTSTVNVGYTTHPANFALIDGTCWIIIVNPKNRPIQILTDFPIASVKSVELQSKHTRIAATALRSSPESKLRKVLHKYKIYALSDSTPHTQQLLLMVLK